MPTEKQILASRANGARSKGPITAQGKLNSSRNSARHNLLASTIVLEEESGERFHELLTSLMEERQPRSATQLMLVETMAAARWRQLRVWGVQKCAIDREMALQDPSVGPAPVRAISALANSPEVFLRYEIAFDRQFTRALARLMTLQSQSAPSNPEPNHPESPAGQTWQEDTPATERTQQTVETEASPIGVLSREFAPKTSSPFPPSGICDKKECSPIGISVSR